MGESFDQTFSKVCAVEAAKASSRSAEREILPIGVFFLRTFSFAPTRSKEKVAKEFVYSNTLLNINRYSQIKERK